MMRTVAKTAAKTLRDSMGSRRAPAVADSQPKRSGKQLRTDLVKRSIKGSDLGEG